MHLRLQTNGIGATQAVEQGLETLTHVCDHMLDVFDEAYASGDGEVSPLPVPID
jgi:hypothetical protein